jgi:exopolysaccharide production protein ExoZ
LNASSPGISSKRITCFEGLRGYAVALVFLVHFIDHYFARTGQIDFNQFDLAAPHTAAQVLAYWAWASHYGVDLFFLLSGFLIFRLMVRPDFDFGRFLWQRVHRLYPAFGVALLLYTLYQGHYWNLWRDWSTLLCNAVFLQGIFELGIPAVIVQSWSLSFEWLFYLTAPVLLLLVRRGRGPLRAWHVLLAGALTLAPLLPLGHHYARFVMFFAGGLLAATPVETTKTWIARVPEAAVVGAYVAVTTFFALDHDFAHFAWAYAVSCLLLVAKATYGNGLLTRVFCWAPMRALGNISYSFYLLHNLALVVVVDHVGPLLKVAGAVQFCVLLVLSLAVGVGASRVSYRLLEQPYFQRRRPVSPPDPVSSEPARAEMLPLSSPR